MPDLPPPDLPTIVAELHADGPHRVAGAVVEPDGVRTAFASGADDTTVFELGSLTKVYNALLVADAAERGELALDQPVAELLPDDWSFRGGDPITVADLASHRGGLSRIPPNMGWWYLLTHLKDPYAAYGEERLRRAVARTHPQAGGYAYSNYGAGLLGFVVAHRAGAPWLALLTERVLEPLGLDATGERDDAVLPQGHTPRGRPTPPWHFEVLAPAGSLDSTLDDQVRWVQAWLSPDRSSLADAMAACLVVRNTFEDGEVALGWHLRRVDERRLFWHNGGTGGFSSFAGFAPDRDVGVVLLSSRMQAPELTEAGLALLAAVGDATP